MEFMEQRRASSASALVLILASAHLALSAVVPSRATSVLQKANGTICPEDCNTHGSCREGRCFCFAGWLGETCSEQDCSPCINGKCVDGECQCTANFTGPACRWPACPNDCQGQGACVEGRCFCEDGWTGPDCALGPCPNLCSGHGRCEAGGCACADGFNGR